MSDPMRELFERLITAQGRLQTLSENAEIVRGLYSGSEEEAARLRGKIEGVDIALGYIDEYFRSMIVKPS